MLDRDRGKLCCTVRCNGRIECRAGRNLPTIDLEKIKNFLKNTGFVELPGRGWVCPDCFRYMEEETRRQLQTPDEPGAVKSGRSELYRDRTIDILPSKTGFDVHLDGKPRMHSFETAEDAMAAAKEYIDDLIAYRERTGDSESANWEANRLEAEADEAARSWGEDLYR